MRSMQQPSCYMSKHSFQVIISGVDIFDPFLPSRVFSRETGEKTDGIFWQRLIAISTYEYE